MYMGWIVFLKKKKAYGGLIVQQPVIPPLLGARGGRCSVKPASRCALWSKSHETCALAQVPCLNSQLGVGKPAKLHRSI
ncbi:hypothetical protein Lal_00029417 [Lupinus albus]|nr:hypothetical protein Lal_00029417 [Lupinus albus]